MWRGGAEAHAHKGSDFTDGSHLNVKGTEKISTWLAQWLVKNYFFID